MLVKSLEVSMFATNCYLVACSDTGDGVVIDPGAQGKRILEAIKSNKINIKYIINTHSHVDHIGANSSLKEALKVPVLLNKKDLELYKNPGFGLGLVVGKQPIPDKFLQEGDKLSVGNLQFTVIETPGHTRGGICLLTDKAVFTGDTLFAGSIGRTDLAGGSFTDIINSIKERLLTLPPETVVYPGHGPVSTIESETRSNPFLQ